MKRKAPVEKEKKPAREDRTKTALPRLRFPGFEGEWRFENGDVLFDPISDKDHNSDLPILAITQEYGAIPRNMIDYQVVVTDKSVESYKVVQVGDFIISLRSFQGGIEYSRYQGICSPAYIILRKKRSTSYENFYRFYFKTDKFIAMMNERLEGIRDGKMVSYSQFSELMIPSPSEREQQKIANCLNSLDDLIAAHNRKLNALNVNKEGLESILFPGNGETVPLLRFTEFHNTKEWFLSSISCIADISSGTTPFRMNDEFYNGGLIPWVKTLDLNNQLITSTEECITEKARARINPVGSVLIAMYGGYKQIGRTGLLSIPAATNQAISVLVLREKMIIPVFLLAWLNAKVDLWKRIASSSRKDPNITSNDIGKFPISFPSLPEQQKIADCLSALDSLIAAETKMIESLKLHKKGLMQVLFPDPDEVGA